jgi:hypothetical protein
LIVRWAPESAISGSCDIVNILRSFTVIYELSTMSENGAPLSPVPSIDTQHSDDEWEAQRVNFTLYYKEQNHTLKQATDLMIQNHDFHATQRQWERKIIQWKLQKYMSRQARLDDLEAQGRTVAEVAETGRRSENLLRPDDRNARRFARREMKRSRSRSSAKSRSQSFDNRSRPSTPDFQRGRSPSAPDLLVEQERTYALNLSPLADPTAQQSLNNTPVPISAFPVTHNTQLAQAHVMQTHDVVSGEISQSMYLSLPMDTMSQNVTTHNNSDISDGQYGYGNLANIAPQMVDDPFLATDANMPFPALALDTNMSGDMMHQQRGAQISNSAPLPAPGNLPWSNDQMYRDADLAEVASAVSDGVHSGHSSFYHTPVDDISMTQMLEADLGAQSQDMPPIPDIVLPEQSMAAMNISGASDATEIPPNQYIDPNMYRDFHSAISRYTQAVQMAVANYTIPGPEPMASHLTAKLQGEGQQHKSDAFVSADTSPGSKLMSELTRSLNQITINHQRVVEKSAREISAFRGRSRNHSAGAGVRQYKSNGM